MTEVRKIRVENVVASASLNQELDLELIAMRLKNAEYEPEQFPGLVYRLSQPKTALLLFSSGKMVCTGAKSVEEIYEAINKVIEELKKAGIEIRGEPEVQIQNIVASADLGFELNLDEVALGLGLENVEYEPEQFPGLVYRMDDPKVVLLLFGSGKLVCTGAKRPEDAQRAVDKIYRILTDLGLARS